MNSWRRTAAWCGLALFCVGITWLKQEKIIRDVDRPDAEHMRRASTLAAKWFEIVLHKKDSVGLVPEAFRVSGYRGLLGEEYSSFTTTLGSLDAKETTLNPDFAALVVRILRDEHIDSTMKVGVTLSGSFPVIGIATLAALRSLNTKAVVMSSLGASSYGANQPKATWLDHERWLHEAGELSESSLLVTYGGEGDSGGGIEPEGLAELDAAARRAGKRIFVPRDLQHAIAVRVKLLVDERVDLLINLGGNQAVLGGCVHGSTHPNGFHRSLNVCSDADRGVISEMNARGIPILHLLNINDLAARYSLPLGGTSDRSLQGVYQERAVDRWSIAGLLALIAGAIVILARNQRYFAHASRH